MKVELDPYVILSVLCVCLCMCTHKHVLAAGYKFTCTPSSSQFLSFQKTCLEASFWPSPVLPGLALISCESVFALELSNIFLPPRTWRSQGTAKQLVSRGLWPQKGYIMATGGLAWQDLSAPHICKGPGPCSQ